MRHGIFVFLFLFLTACASNRNLQRVVHQTPNLLVVLDKSDVQASPSFAGPFHHPAMISADRLQQILGSVMVQPQTGFLRSLFGDEKKNVPLFDREMTRLMAHQLSQALSKADPSERIVFYRILPDNTVTDAVTSGFLLVKDTRLHLRVKHFKVPLRKGLEPSSAGRGIPKSEKSKFAFILSEGDHMTHRNFKNIIGFSASDSHWLVIDYAAFAAPSPEASPVSPPFVKTKELEVEERLRTLRYLRKEGLITEEEYTEKKKSILKNF